MKKWKEERRKRIGGNMKKARPRVGVTMCPVDTARLSHFLFFFFLFVSSFSPRPVQSLIGSSLRSMERFYRIHQDPLGSTRRPRKKEKKTHWGFETTFQSSLILPLFFPFLSASFVPLFLPHPFHISFHSNHQGYGRSLDCFDTSLVGRCGRLRLGVRR